MISSLRLRLNSSDADIIVQTDNFKLQQTFSGKTVISSRLDIFGTPEKDLDTGIWTQSADYLMSYYE